GGEGITAARTDWKYSAASAARYCECVATLRDPGARQRDRSSCSVHIADAASRRSSAVDQIAVGIEHRHVPRNEAGCPCHLDQASGAYSRCRLNLVVVDIAALR